MTLHKGGIIVLLTLALHTSLSSQTNMTNPETLEGNYHPPQRGRGPPHPNPTVRTRASDRATTTIASDGTTLQVIITPSPRARTTRPRSTQRSMSSTESITRSTPRPQPYFTNNHSDKPVCMDRSKWRYIAEKSVMPKVFTIRYLPEIFPQLFKFISGPDGHSVAIGIPENAFLYRDRCLQLCLNETEFQCRFFAFVHPYVCIEAQHTNEFEINSGFSNPFFEVPRVCLPNDGCKREGEYFADSFSRCHFYQCSHGGGNTLQATQHHCPPSTITRESFLTSRDMPLSFTQPCSEFGSNCVRDFPRFAP